MCGDKIVPPAQVGVLDDRCVDRDGINLSRPPLTVYGIHPLHRVADTSQGHGSRGPVCLLPGEKTGESMYPANRSRTRYTSSHSRSFSPAHSDTSSLTWASISRRRPLHSARVPHSTGHGP